MRGLRQGRPPGDEAALASARRYEAFGRVMAALATEAEVLESCRDLTWWRGADHSWHLEWRDGPSASEVAALLVERVRDPDHDPDNDGDLVTPMSPAGAASAVLDVMGVRVELRAIDPMGRERLRVRQNFWRLAEALDTSRPAGARRAWEELLGG
ncbi:hypothetical protein [Thermoactinospora rubra]|uniref:hypothetical protein n=1 Tax=Thermoactinospora rubra TaxID=1088767 RepID=UPI001F0A6AE6|nr:hypothetical protein [Thermoactinospora rubra]